jgi:hypothetical protein
VVSNDMLRSTLPIWSVCRHSPLLASQILAVMSSDADASRAEPREKATDQIQPLWPLSVCRHSPLQILAVMSPDADASRAESCEKATDLTQPLWPSSVCRQVFHLSVIAGFIVIHFGSSFLKMDPCKAVSRTEHEYRRICLKGVVLNPSLTIRDKSTRIVNKVF